MRVNSVLGLWNGGWVAQSDAAAIAAAGYRAEGFLSIGSQQSETEALRICDAVLDVYATPRQSLDASFDPPSAAERPYVAFRPGDTVTVDSTPVKVQAMRVALTDDGPTYEPRFGDPIPTEEERIATTLKKMSAGTFGGDAKIATPIDTVGRGGGGAGGGDSVSAWIYGLPVTNVVDPADSTENYVINFGRAIPLTWHVTVNVIATEFSSVDPDVSWVEIEGYIDGGLPDPPGGPGCSWQGFPLMRVPVGEVENNGRLDASYTFVVSTIPGSYNLGGRVRVKGFGSAVVWVSYVAVPSTGATQQFETCGA